MPLYDDLLVETEAERAAFVGIPIIQQALAGKVNRRQYLAFLGEAFHHVKHTCRLLGFAAGHCRDADQRYLDALLDYIAEERGHEQWILDDIRALGGDADSIARGEGGIACRAMVGYMYAAIARESPYAMLGMVHVLEGMSATLATSAAASLRQALASQTSGGFSYLESHGDIDREHVAFFRDLVNGIAEPLAQRAIIDTAKVIYRLYGDVFRSLTAGAERDAA